MASTPALVVLSIGVFVIVVVLIILFLKYKSFDAYEQQLLMRIPEYRILKEKLNSNEAQLNQLKKDKADLDSKYEKLVSDQNKTLKEQVKTKAELDKARAEISEKQSIILNNAEEISKLTEEISKLKTINSNMAANIKNITTKHLSEVTDYVIKSFSFKDDVLVSRIKDSRNSIITAMKAMRNIQCTRPETVRKFKLFMGQIITEMRMPENAEQVNSLCNKTSLQNIGKQIRADMTVYYPNVCTNINGITDCFPNMMDPKPKFGSIQEQMVDMFFQMEVLIIHVILNNFCDGPIFDINKFEAYTWRLIKAMCDQKEDWVPIVGQGIDYLLSKPISYV